MFKKRMLTKILIIFTLLILTPNVHVNAESTVDLKSTESGYDVIISEESDESFTLIVPALDDPYLDVRDLIGYNPYQTSTLSIAGVIAFAKIVIQYGGYVLGACEIIEYISVSFNPCIVARDALVNFIKNGPYTQAKIFVSRTYVSGKIPGCEPSHSYQCNSGYYKYTFSYA